MLVAWMTAFIIAPLGPCQLCGMCVKQYYHRNTKRPTLDFFSRNTPTTLLLLWQIEAARKVAIQYSYTTFSIDNYYCVLSQGISRIPVTANGERSDLICLIAYPDSPIFCHTRPYLSTPPPTTLLLFSPARSCAAFCRNFTLISDHKAYYMWVASCLYYFLPLRTFLWWIICYVLRTCWENT